MPSRCRVGTEATSSQTRRCQVAEEMREPPSGRAQEGRRQPFCEVSGSHGTFAFSFRGPEFYFGQRNRKRNLQKPRGSIYTIDRRSSNWS
jgi:hypothetical protein